MRKKGSAREGMVSLRGMVAVGLCVVAAFCGTLSLRANPKAPAGPVPMNWSMVNSPDMTQQGLRRVTCIYASDCWSVGWYVNESGGTRRLAQRWNGSAWTVVPTPNVTNTYSNRLNDVTCNSASDCWAVGRSKASGIDSTLI